MRARTGVDFNSHNKKTININSEVKKEFAKQEAEFAHLVAVQTTATIFYVLNKQYGFGAKRLKNVISAVTGNTLLGESGVFGKTFDNTDMVAYLKGLGVDLEKEIKTEVGYK